MRLPKKRSKFVWQADNSAGGRFSFLFYSNENAEPPHVHVRKGEGEGKVWLMPTIEVAYLVRFTNRDEKIILEITKANASLFKQKWNEHFGQQI